MTRKKLEDGIEDGNGQNQRVAFDVDRRENWGSIAADAEAPGCA